MSTSEPFMPAHEPRPARPPQEHDLDHEVDVFLDEAAEPVAGDEAPWHTGAEPAVRRPEPGAHLTAEQLSADFDSADDGTGDGAE